MGILNCCGVREVTWLQTGITVLKMATLGFISVTGVALLVRGKEENVERFQTLLMLSFQKPPSFQKPSSEGILRLQVGDALLLQQMWNLCAFICVLSVSG